MHLRKKELIECLATMRDIYFSLKQENQQLQEELECTIGIVEHNRIISEKNKEINQLKDNWNELKKFALEKQVILFGIEYTCYSNILDKMQELEGSET